MASFIVRIELRGGATAVDYAKLHEEMAAANLGRTIVSDTGKRYHLPSATYYMTSDLLSLKEVFELASTTAHGVKKGPLVLVTKGDSQWALVSSEEPSA